MGIDVAWHDAEQTALSFNFTPGWSWDDMHAAIEQSHALMYVSPHPKLHLIFDTLDSGDIPRGALTNLLRIFRNVHPKTGRLIVIDDKQSYHFFMAQQLLYIIRKVHRIKVNIEFVDNIEDVDVLLRQPVQHA